MTISQISVFVENKQGSMSGIAEVLAGANIDIRALTIADTTDFGILRLIVQAQGSLRRYAHHPRR